MRFLSLRGVLLVTLSYFFSPADVILIVAHLLIPIIKGLGFVPPWFAVIRTANLEIGFATPPAG
jgi:TRAP-type C4-dicarboxylate transport system permease large subunit